jgi:tetratricopeptide (TPR) repeat protein
MNRLWVAMVAVVMGLSICGGAWAQEVEAGPDAAERDAKREEMKKQWRDVLRVYRKQRKGEELTDEEEALLDRAKLMKERMERARKEREVQLRERRERDRMRAATAERGKGVGGVLQRDDRMSILDNAYYDIAGIHLARKRHAEAIAALEQLIKKSSDETIAALTHLNLAEIYRRRLSNTEKAVDEYKKVTGPLAREAQNRLARMFEELDRLDDAILQFEAIAENAKDKTQKVLALRQLAELLVRNGREDEALAALKKLTETVNHEEAAKITTVLREEEARRLEQEREQMERARIEMMKRWQRGARGPRNRGPRGQDAELRPRGLRPDGVRDKRFARPVERPIEPDAD